MEGSMTRLVLGLALGLIILAGPLAAQERAGSVKGKIKKIDAVKNVLTITIKDKDGDKDAEFSVTDDSKLYNARKDEIKDGLKNKQLKEGVEVELIPKKSDGKMVILALRIVGKDGRPGVPGLKGKIKKLDVEKKTVTLTVAGKDQEFVLTDDTKVGGAAADAKTLKDRLKDFKEGSEVEIITKGKQDGKEVIIAIRPAGKGTGEKARSRGKE
jgi:translation elongation factor P/translation initiation factor 5A